MKSNKEKTDKLCECGHPKSDHYKGSCIAIIKEDYDEDFRKMENSLRLSILKYPNCKIANCDCDSKHGERKTKSNGEKCYCLCHIDEIIKENPKQHSTKEE